MIATTILLVDIVLTSSPKSKSLDVISFTLNTSLCVVPAY